MKYTGVPPSVHKMLPVPPPRPPLLNSPCTVSVFSWLGKLSDLTAMSLMGIHWGLGIRTKQGFQNPNKKEKVRIPRPWNQNIAKNNKMTFSAYKQARQVLRRFLSIHIQTLPPIMYLFSVLTTFWPLYGYRDTCSDTETLKQKVLKTEN